MAYTPYKMKADNNDPMTKNFGGVAPGKMRAFGTKTLEGPKKTDTNPGSGLNYTSGVGSSPAKGWLKNLGKKISGGTKNMGKALGIGGKGGGGGGFGNIKEMDARISALEEGGGGGGVAQAEPGIVGTPGAEAGAEAVVDPKKAALEKAQGMMGQMSDTATTMLSDVRLKEKIKKVGKSPSGIPIYMFNYIGENKRYKGTMAQDLICMGIDAVETHESGYYMVDYSKIDVDMKLIN